MHVPVEVSLLGELHAENFFALEAAGHRREKALHAGSSTLGSLALRLHAHPKVHDVSLTRMRHHLGKRPWGKLVILVDKRHVRSPACGNTCLPGS